MKNFIISVFCFISINQSAISSDLKMEKEFVYFDSLLFDGEIEQLEVALKKSNKSLPTYEDSVKQLSRFNKYYRVIQYKKNFLGHDNNYMLDYIKSKKLESKYFSKSFAGEKASIIYNKFLSSLNSLLEIDALKYSFIADYFRSIVLEESISKIRNLYNLVKKNYNESKYKDLLAAYNENKIDVGNNYTLNSYQDSLNILYKSALLKQRDIENKELYWDTKDEINKTWYLSIGLLATFQPSQDNLTFDFSDQNPPAFYSDINSAKRNDFGFSIEAMRNVTKSFSIGADIMFTKFTYNSKFEMNLIFFDYSQRIISTHLKTNYYLRKFVGFRPFVGVGLGYFRVSRDESIIKVLNGDQKYEYVLLEKTVSSLQSVYELGIQFISNKNSKMFYNLKSKFYLNHKDLSELKSSFMTISVHFGLLF